MALKFCANISWLFRKEAPKLTDRYLLANNAGFKAVESGPPYDTPLDELVTAKESSGLEHVLINAYYGSKDGDLGLAALPDRVKDFQESLDLTVMYAKALNCRKIHILSGCVGSYSPEELDNTYISNLKYAANVLEKNDIIGCLEPLNILYTAPKGYYLNCPEKAADVVKTINHPKIRFQLDIFHQQIIRGNLTYDIQKYWPLVGHIQVAQVPNRTEMDSPGEVNFEYILDLLAKQDYSDWIGLEYGCSSDTHSGIQWIQKFGYSL